VRLEGSINLAPETENRGCLLAEALRALRPEAAIYLHGLAGDRASNEPVTLPGRRRVARAAGVGDCLRRGLLRDVDVSRADSSNLKLQQPRSRTLPSAVRLRKPSVSAYRCLRPAGFLHLQETGFTEDSQTFGNVVLRHANTPRDFADIEWRVHQQADDPNPGVLAQRFECDDAVRLERGGRLAKWQAAQLNGSG